MKTKFVIAFAGVPGSSKSPIAHHLGWNLGLPVFNNDTIRTEVREDLLEYDVDEYQRRLDERLEALFDKKVPFIHDASIDRKWEEFSKKLEKHGYEYFIINLEPSRERVEEMYKAKDYSHFFEFLEQWQSEHSDFLSKYGDEVGLSIGDKDFAARLDIALETVTTWIQQ